MDFSLTEDQEMFRTQIKRILEKYEYTKITRDAMKGNTLSLQTFMETIGEMGVQAIPVPEKYDGLGLGALDLVPTYEEMGKSLVPGTLMETLSIVVPLLKKYGTDEQKEKYLPQIASGETVFSIAAIESNRDFSELGIQLPLVEIDGKLILNGVKTAVPLGKEVNALLVIARAKEGVTLIVIENMDEIHIDELDSFEEAEQLAEVSFHQVEIFPSQILGEKGNGWKQLEEGLLYFNAALSAYLVGAMNTVVNMATEYAKIREQFGQPIGRFQAVKHSIVDMKVNLDIAKSLSYYANWVVDSEENDREAAIYNARTYATEKFIQAASNNIQIHGGIGFTEEIDCHLFVKRARYYHHYLGSVTYYQEKIADALGW